MNTYKLLEMEIMDIYKNIRILKLIDEPIPEIIEIIRGYSIIKVIESIIKVIIFILLHIALLWLVFLTFLPWLFSIAPTTINLAGLPKDIIKFDIGQFLVFVGALITAYIAWIKYLGTQVTQQFNELSKNASSTEELICANALATLPIFSLKPKESVFEHYLTLKDIKDQYVKFFDWTFKPKTNNDNPDTYLKNYHQKFPYVQESVNIIINVLKNEALKRAKNESNASPKVISFSYLELVASEALSKINNNSYNDELKVSAVDLSNKNCYKTFFFRIDLSGSYLSKFDLYKALCLSSNFSKANLDKAILNQAILTEANFSGAILTKAEFKSAQLRRSNLSDAKLSGANLAGADLEEAILSNADLSKTNLYSASLKDADLSSANLFQAIFSWQKDNVWNLAGVTSQLLPATLSNANLMSADLTEANLDSCDLSNANLTGAKLEKTVLFRANLTEANLDRCNLSKATLFKSNLSSACFRGAHLEYSDLRRTDLSNANFTETLLINVQFYNINEYSGIILNNAIVDFVTYDKFQSTIFSGYKYQPIQDFIQTRKKFKRLQNRSDNDLGKLGYLILRD